MRYLIGHVGHVGRLGRVGQRTPGATTPAGEGERRGGEPDSTDRVPPHLPGRGRAGAGSQTAQTECHHTARRGELEGEPEGGPGRAGEGEPGSEGWGGSWRPTRPTCPIRLTRPMTDSRSIPPEEITAKCTAGHPPHRYYSDYPPRYGRAAAEGRGPAHREEVHLPPGIRPV